LRNGTRDLESFTCCFAPRNVGVDVVLAEREAREGVDVWEVIVLCERMEERSQRYALRVGGGAVAMSMGAGR